MAQPTSQQEAVLVTLKEGWQTYGLKNTSYTQHGKGAEVDTYTVTCAEVPV